MVNHVARVSEEKNKEKYLYSFLQEEETNTHILPEIHDPEFGTILRNFPSTPSTHSRKEEGHICPQSGLFKDGPHRGNPPSAGGQVSTHTDEVGGGGHDRVSKQLHAHLPVIHEPPDGGLLARGHRKLRRQPSCQISRVLHI